MWKEISSDDDLNRVVLEESNTQPVVLFKHSTRCPVSFTAKKMFEMQWNKPVDAYLLDLIAYRNISNRISSELNVFHESPQVLVISKGECIYNASHGSIDADAVHKVIQEI